MEIGIRQYDVDVDCWSVQIDTYREWLPCTQNVVFDILVEVHMDKPVFYWYVSAMLTRQVFIITLVLELHISLNLSKWKTFCFSLFIHAFHVPVTIWRPTLLDWYTNLIYCCFFNISYNYNYIFDSSIK